MLTLPAASSQLAVRTSSLLPHPNICIDISSMTVTLLAAAIVVRQTVWWFTDILMDSLVEQSFEDAKIAHRAIYKHIIISYL
jgi:hypothetical protein